MFTQHYCYHDATWYYYFPVTKFHNNFILKFPPCKHTWDPKLCVVSGRKSREISIAPIFIQRNARIVFHGDDFSTSILDVPGIRHSVQSVGQSMLFPRDPRSWTISSRGIDRLQGNAVCRASETFIRQLLSKYRSGAPRASSTAKLHIHVTRVTLTFSVKFDNKCCLPWNICTGCSAPTVDY